MAFTLYAYTPDVDYTNGHALILNDGDPYKLESMDDGGPAPVVRFEQNSPDQHGATDLGYRLQPRTLTLRVLFRDGSDVIHGALTDNRDVLFGVFAPVQSVIKLRIQRDDGTHRILECQTVSIDIDVLPEHYPARLNRATITMRAANPFWRTVTAGSASCAGTAQWWTGNGAIGTANVMEYGNNPRQGQPWTYQGTITGAWSILFRSGSVAPGSAIAIYHAGTGDINAGTASKDARIAGGSTHFYFAPGHAAFLPTMTAGTQNYIILNTGSNSLRAVVAGSIDLPANTYDQDISGTARRWRSARTGGTTSYWPEPLPYYAVYNVALSAGQRTALHAAVEADLSSSTTGTITAVNAGDTVAYPIITLRGPLHNPVLTNLATGAVIDLTGVSIASGSVWTMDLRDGHKALINAGNVSQLGSLGTPIQLASWSLAPSPVASGGTNLIRVEAGSMTTDTLVTVSHYDQFMSF